ncbi:hypothetical protein C2S52_009804 [Perilla frutescens var. hirtella]|nr:hypothetical protein C2S52_009804 [Perilla frutescens var. hirtella]
MSMDVSDRARRVWDEWNLRVAVLVSLFLQTILIVSASSRRRKGGILLTAIIWSSYLLADWIAAFAVGLISSGQTNDCPEKTAVNNQLAAFWAPFLLLHLGGPDDITAFSLEDNELWIRHLLGLLIQVVAVVYVFVQSLQNEYWIPIVLLFFAGVCKYAERTLSLYKACLGNFKRSLLPEPDSGPNYAQLMEEYSALDDSHVKVTIEIVKETAKANNGEQIIASSEPERLHYLDIVLKGYHFFDVFKGLVVDHMFSFHERNESRFFFFERTASDAFRVMEVELNFLYDVLFTKMGLVHCKIGYICRSLSTALLAACFQQFASHPHHSIYLFDKIVTYILLVGAVSLDVVGVFKLVSSDWVIVSAKEKAARVLIRLRAFCRREQRWSDSMAQHSFISFCLKEEQRFRWLNKVAVFFRMKEVLDEFRYKKKKACGEKLKELVFNELKAKALNAETTKMAKEIYSARGDNVLSDYPSHYSHPSISASLSDEVEYDESLLLWHIATELCYFTRSIPEEDEATETEPEEDETTETEPEEDEATETEPEEDEATETRPEEDEATERKKARIEMCKALSDYMLYLLIMRPTLMSTVAGIAQIRFQDTCKEANKFFKRWQSEIKTDGDRDQRREACVKLLDVKTVVKPNEVKGDRSKSLLFDACILANDLKKLSEDKRWEMMSRVWVELLSYGASRCRASDHARQLSHGGEFITFVWLLMVHFGLGEQFRIEAGHARAKLLQVDKISK